MFCLNESLMIKKSKFYISIIDFSFLMCYINCTGASSTVNTMKEGEELINLDYHSKKPIYEQIMEQMKLLVIKGNLKPGDAIPSVRKMAQMLDVTPSTVAKAYQELERQKVIETLRAKGTFIATDPVVVPNQDELEKIRGRLQSEMIELKRIGYSETDVVKLVQEIYKSIG